LPPRARGRRAAPGRTGTARPFRPGTDRTPPGRVPRTRTPAAPRRPAAGLGGSIASSVGRRLHGGTDGDAIPICRAVDGARHRVSVEGRSRAANRIYRAAKVSIRSDESPCSTDHKKASSHAEGTETQSQFLHSLRILCVRYCCSSDSKNVGELVV